MLDRMAEPPQQFLIENGDITQAYVEWHADKRGHGPSIFMTHATGFHSRMWDEIACHLTDFHIIAVDQRGHGKSTGDPVDHWKLFGQDLMRLIEMLDLNNIVGVGHSMGGHATIDAAARLQSRFRNIIAIDPVIAPPEAYEYGGQLPFSTDELHPASKRKAFFTSPEEMYDRFEDRLPYKLFTEPMLRNYCVYGLEECDEGGYRLACAPEMEASVYMSSRSNGAIYDSIRALELPVLIIRGRVVENATATDFTSSPTWPQLADQFRNGRDFYMQDRTHFIPMEIPADVAAIIREEATK